MRSEKAPREEMWSELIDRDLDLLIDGKQPYNSDLVPLRSFVSTLGSFGVTELSPGFPEDHAAEGAAMVRAQLSDTTVPLSTVRRLTLGLKRRVTAAAVSLMMIVGMTGVAWAADSAVPGDWNYGIDRALESLGIGAGGAEERLQELAVVSEDGHVRGVRIASRSGGDVVAGSGDPVVGLEKAAASVDTPIRGSQSATDVGEAVSALLGYLANPDGVRPNISELAQQFKQDLGSSESNRPEVNPGEDHRPDHAGKPPR
ncbi:MAG: hypothetical protein V3S32_02215 [Acidimicrobiia bacterium]